MLLVLASPGTGAVVALNWGWVPTVLMSGVAGTLKVLLLPGAIGPALRQVTTWLAVVQTQPLLLKLAGADTPAGSVTVLVSGPVAGPWPLLVIVIGTLLACPTAKLGEGWPTLVVISGEKQLADAPP